MVASNELEAEILLLYKLKQFACMLHANAEDKSIIFFSFRRLEKKKYCSMFSQGLNKIPSSGFA